MSFSVEALFAWFEAMAHDPISLAAALALSTLVTEDGALVAGSLLVGSAVASPLLVIAALTIGIVGGDIALYGAGWTASEFRWLKRKLPIKKAKKVRHWLRGREAMVLFFSRFMPGTRLVTYVTFGFLRLSLARFLTVMSVAAMIWVTALVLFISEIQQAFSSIGAVPAALVAAGIAIILIIFTPKIMRRSRHAISLDEASPETTAANDQ